MKKIFIYYSLSGNGDIIADYLTKKKITIRKAISEEKMPQSKFLRIVVGGFLALKNHTPKLPDFDNNIEEYDKIIIGSPIWNGRLSPPINTVLNSIDLNNKEISFVLYSGSGDGPKAVEKIKETYPTAKIIQLKEPKKHPELLDKLLKDI